MAHGGASFDYFTIPNYPGEKPAGIEDLDEYLPVAKQIALCRGVPMGQDLFARKTVSLRKKYGNQLADFLRSVDRLLVLSDRARGFFLDQGFAEAEVEFIPFKLKDKKGQPRTEKYFIANPLVHVACLDIPNSDSYVVFNPVTRKEDRYVSVVRVFADKIPPDARLFRLAEDPRRILIRSDLLGALKEAGLTGLVEAKLGESIA
jgi:hypothetical protein